MEDRVLASPASWVEQLHTVAIDALVISYNSHTLKLPPGRSLADVRRDILAGVWLSRERSRKDEFRLGGSEFELRVKRRQGEDNREWMAVLLGVDEAASVPRRLRVVPDAVDFSDVWDEAPCDLAEIEARLRLRERQLSARNGGTRRQAEVWRHGRLQAAVLREYGELETLVGVLEQRPEQPEESIEGVVRPDEDSSGRRPSFVVEPTEGDPDAFRGKRIQLTRSSGRSYNTTVRSVRRGRIHVAQPRDCAFGASERVSLAIVRPFGMRQNAEALTRFRGGDVEGSWEDLARLLCRPGDLSRPPLTPLPLYYCDSDPDVPNLNAEQRRAVAGVVGTPHTFLIQGPPGTGKTEVICEAVRQLVARGERVLLLAPTHVAVDEVLSRIGRKPGVRPLRITWSDDLVDDALHSFLPRNVGVEFARNIVRPTEHGQADRWRREFTSVRERLRHIEELRAVEEKRPRALAALRAATQLATETAERLATTRAGTDREITTLRLAEERAEQDMAAAEATARESTLRHREEFDELRPGFTVLRDAAREMAIEGRAAGRATAELRRLEDEWRSWDADQRAMVARSEEAWRAAEQAVQDARPRRSAASDDLARAQAALDRARGAQGVFGKVTEFFGLGAVTEAREHLGLAKFAAQGWQVALTKREEELRHAVAAHNRLLANAEPAGERARQQINSASHTLIAANDRHTTAVRRFADMLAVLGGRLPNGARRHTPSARLGESLDSVLSAAVEPSSTPPSYQAAPGLEPVAKLLDRLRDAATDRAAREGAVRTISVRHEATTNRLAEALRSAGAELDLRTAERDAAEREQVAAQSEVDALAAERERLFRLAGENPNEAELRLRRRQSVLAWLPALDLRWRELAEERTGEQFLEDMKHSLIRASNLVCATTKGIVGRGSDLVRHTDYDTLIVDEASRVTESEFLIGAVRSRRWVLVGDEHQLPPYVDQDDEHFLHALTALHRVGRGAADTVERAVDDLAAIWSEDERERAFRTESVRKVAEELASSGQWATAFQLRFAEVHQRFNRRQQEAEIDRRILESMRRYLVQSLFERAVTKCGMELRQPLEIQRRMIAPLAEIVNRPVYGGQYRSPPDAELAETGVTPLVLPRLFERPAIFLDTSRYRDAGEKQIRHGFVNRREQEMIVRACTIYNDELRDPISVSVLAFYRAQARELERRLLAMRLPMMRWEVIDVIDRIQGQQSDLVILSFTRANPGGFGDNYGQWLQDLRRLNVACTRARRALVLVGHTRTLRRLRAREEARLFYANLLDLFDSNDNFQRIEQLD